MIVVTYSISQLGKLAYLLKNNSPDLQQVFKKWLCKEVKKLSYVQSILLEKDEPLEEEDVCGEIDGRIILNYLYSLTYNPSSVFAERFCEAVDAYDNAKQRFGDIKKKGFFYIIQHWQQFKKAKLEMKKQDQVFFLKQIVEVAVFRMGRTFLQEMCRGEVRSDRER